jgi:hypothetical protein
MNAREVLLAFLFCAVSTITWAQLPPGVSISGGVMTIGPGAGQNVIINGYNGPPITSVIVPNSNTNVMVNGVMFMSTSAMQQAAPAQVRPDGTPAEIKSDFPRRGGFGAPPGLNVRIKDDGIALPKGVGDSSKDKDKEKDGSRASCGGVGREGQACGQDGKASDAVSERIDKGFERNPGAAKPADVKVEGTAVQVPKCFGESRDGVSCQ